MPTDYIMFIHGVNTKDDLINPQYAKGLINLLNQSFGNSPCVKYISLYWGDIMENPKLELKQKLQQSTPEWSQVWMKDFRENQIMSFAGDAVLYISRHVGYKAVERIANVIQKELSNATSEDRLHFVGHSWGSFILFDIFFAGRWDTDIPGYKEIQSIRSLIFGLPPVPENGIRLASIHTMGSPIAFFNLINIAGTNEKGGSTHNITTQLNLMLENLKSEFNGRKLPWWNYIHPGDLIAYPLAQVGKALINEQNEQSVIIMDKVVQDDWLSLFFLPLSQTILPIVHGGDAHQSYWNSKTIAENIIQIIKKYRMSS